MMGTPGRSCEIRRAENPVSVKATMARAPRSWAAWAAALEIVSAKPGDSCRSGPARQVDALSAREAMRAM